MKRILVVGSWRMPHFQRFSKYIVSAATDAIEINLLENSPIYTPVDFDGYNIKYTPSNNYLRKLIDRIPGLRIWYSVQKQKQILTKILSENHYDLVNFHVVSQYTSALMDITREMNVKTMLTPYGSEILRVSDNKKQALLNDAFCKTDFISSPLDSSFSNKIEELYQVERSKFVNLSFGSETISEVSKYKDLFTREELSQKLNIPISSYNICCAYNAARAQNHSTIVKSIIENKDILPQDTQLLFPLTYGGDKIAIKTEIENLLKGTGISAVFFMEYMTSQRVSYIRLLTDLFIHIQSTDAANASLQEFLLAGSQCINGKWLSYPYLEKDGKPYYIVDDKSCLPQVIKQAVISRSNPLRPSNNTLSVIESNSWERVSKQWIMVYNTI